VDHKKQTWLDLGGGRPTGPTPWLRACQSSVQLVARRGEKTSKSASEKFIYLRFALRAMLPVKILYG